MRLAAGGAAVFNAAGGVITGHLALCGASNWLENDGLIGSGVSLGANSTLIDAGQIAGGLALGLGDTLDVVQGGRVGVVTLAGADVMRFSPGCGAVVIDGFRTGNGAGHDTLTVTGSGAAMSQVGADVVIRLDGGDSITLVGVRLPSLAAANVQFASDAPAATVQFAHAAARVGGGGGGGRGGGAFAPASAMPTLRALDLIAGPGRFC